MDTPEPTSGLVNRLVSGIKEKTVKLAEDKLRRAIQVQESPEEAILGFVASAVVAGAQRLEVRVESNDLLLLHDGKMLNAAEVAKLPLVRGELSELGHALVLHLSSPEGRVELSFLSPLGMHQANFTSSGTPTMSTVDLGDLKLAKMTTQIRLRGTGNYRRVNQAIGNELPELALIRRRCFLAPLDLQVSGRSLTRYTHLPSSWITATNFHRHPQVALASVPSTPQQGRTVDLTPLGPQLKGVLAGVCGLAKDPTEAGWYTVVHGAARPLAEISWPSRTWGFIVLEPGAQPSTITEDIQRLTAHMVDALYQDVREVSEEVLTFLEQQRAVLLSFGHDAVELDRTFLQLRQRCSPSSDPKVLSRRLELAATLESMGRHEEALSQYAEVIPIWESEALNHFDKYRYEEGAAVWQKALALHEKLHTPLAEQAAKHLKLAEIGREQRLGFAEQAYRRALALYRSLPEPRPQEELSTLLGLADVLKRNRVLTDSLRFAEEAERAQLALSGNQETRDLVPILKLQAEIHDLLGDYVRSTEFEQRALLLRFKR